MNKHFTIYDDAGVILRTGSCPAEDLHLQARDGERLLEAASNPESDAVDPLTGTLVAGGRPPPPAPVASYADVRRTMYPSVSDQLDMLWHAMDDNVIARAEPFYSVNLAVKTAVPKPAQADDLVFDVGPV